MTWYKDAVFYEVHVKAFADGDGNGIGDFAGLTANLHPPGAHAAIVDVPIDELGLAPDQPYRMQELLSEVSYEWRGPRGFIDLNPVDAPAQIFALRR